MIMLLMMLPSIPLLQSIGQLLLFAPLPNSQQHQCIITIIIIGIIISEGRHSCQHRPDGVDDVTEALAPERDTPHGHQLVPGSDASTRLGHHRQVRDRMRLEAAHHRAQLMGLMMMMMVLRRLHRSYYYHWPALHLEPQAQPEVTVRTDLYLDLLICSYRCRYRWGGTGAEVTDAIIVTGGGSGL